MESARLTVTRRAQDDVQQRQVVVALDRRPWATLLFGETVSTAIEPGHHELRVHNTLVWKTVPFDAQPGGHVRFSVSNRAGRGTYWLVGLFGVGPLYVTVTREP
jgi:hypothetical protein